MSDSVLLEDDLSNARDAPPTASTPIDLPEPFNYRLKKKLLGPPLHSERLENET